MYPGTGNRTIIEAIPMKALISELSGILTPSIEEPTHLHKLSDRWYLQVSSRLCAHENVFIVGSAGLIEIRRVNMRAHISGLYGEPIQ